VMRRAERRTVTLAAEAPVDSRVLAFLNRLSDLLFAAARAVAGAESIAEDVWDKDAEPPCL
jgi:cob(I)alamin adenosyltransferase